MMSFLYELYSKNPPSEKLLSEKAQPVQQPIISQFSTSTFTTTFNKVTDDLKKANKLPSPIKNMLNNVSKKQELDSDLYELEKLNIPPSKEKPRKGSFGAYERVDDLHKTLQIALDYVCHLLTYFNLPLTERTHDGLKKFSEDKLNYMNSILQTIILTYINYKKEKSAVSPKSPQDTVQNEPYTHCSF